MLSHYYKKVSHYYEMLCHNYKKVSHYYEMLCHNYEKVYHYYEKVSHYYEMLIGKQQMPHPIHFGSLMSCPFKNWKT